MSWQQNDACHFVSFVMYISGAKFKEHCFLTTEVKFSLTHGDSQISFKGVIPKGDLVYRQYCLLPAPKHIISYFPGATRFPSYICMPRRTVNVNRKEISSRELRLWTAQYYNGSDEGYNWKTQGNHFA